LDASNCVDKVVVPNWDAEVAVPNWMLQTCLEKQRCQLGCFKAVFEKVTV
jgi:hypothetical protein